MKSLPATYMWTVVDGDNSDQWILPGIHTVNCSCYLVTEVPHDWKDIQFRIPTRGYALTRIGLKRQMNKISRLILSNSRAMEMLAWDGFKQQPLVTISC